MIHQGNLIPLLSAGRAGLLRSLADWREGTNFLIGASKSQWKESPSGDNLLAQRLRKETRTLQHKIERLAASNEGRAGA